MRVQITSQTTSAFPSLSFFILRLFKTQVMSRKITTRGLRAWIIAYGLAPSSSSFFFSRLANHMRTHIDFTPCCIN
jgi:hypothetical protein